jgi:hypothetical protein
VERRRQRQMCIRDRAAAHGFIQDNELATVNRFAENPSAWGESLK